MKIKEKMLVEKQVGREMVSCPTAVGYRHCEHHGVTIGAHFATRSVSVWEERVVERPLTEQEIVDFAYLDYKERAAKYPYYALSVGDVWLTSAIKEHHEAKSTDTKADPALISEPLRASSSSGCPCNRPALECNC